MALFNVREYEETSGRSPFRTWLKSLDGSVRFRVQARVNRIKYDGNFGKVRNLKEGISEMKFSYGGAIRIYFGIYNKGCVILLIGGNKQSQEKGDIKKALLHWRDFQESKDGQKI